MEYKDGKRKMTQEEKQELFELIKNSIETVSGEVFLFGGFAKGKGSSEEFSWKSLDIDILIVVDENNEDMNWYTQTTLPKLKFQNIDLDIRVKSKNQLEKFHEVYNPRISLGNL